MHNTQHSAWLRGVKAAAFGAFAAAALAVSAVSHAQVGISVEVAPPPLPVYEQPEIPEAGLMWAPGYWAYGPEGYFWVPGTWVEPPQPGLLWTPGYWGWSNGLFLWNTGYWGPVVGFYGGVNYGFGYPGRGYEGGYWRENQFYYNRSVTNITNVNVRNVYTRTVVNNVTVQRVSYVGGPGGINARPTAQEEQAAHQQHQGATPAQTQQRESAGTRRELLASVNQGKPQIAATSKAGDFSGHTVVASRAGGPVPAATLQSRPSAQPRPLTAAGLPAQSAIAAKPVPAPVHVRDLPPGEPPAPAREGASDEEKAYAQGQADLAARHQQERDALAQQQERDHAAAATQQRNAQSMAQMEAQHQQQTQALQQRHAVESQQLARPAPRAAAPPAAQPQHH